MIALTTPEQVEAAFNEGKIVEYQPNQWERVVVLLPRRNIELLMECGEYRVREEKL